MNNLEKRLSNLEIQMAFLIKSISKKDDFVNGDIEANRINTSKVDEKVTATESNISDTYTPNHIYEVGEYTIYNNLLWECKVRNSSTPIEGAEWRQVSIAQMILDLNNRVTKLESEE